MDNYSSGYTKNHIHNNRVKYLKGDTKNINKYLKKYKKKFIPFFILENFQEFFKVLQTLICAMTQTQLVANLYLNFVWITILN